jgi:RimJ/RimL family protein N-acetyltransferase
MMRVELFSHPSNQALAAAAASAGFTAEGVLRGYLRERGRRTDAAVYSLVVSDLGA